MKKIAILGSTGSIGRQTLDVIEDLGADYRVVALTAGSNAMALSEQVKRFKPEIAVLNDPEAAEKLSELLKNDECRVGAGPEGQLIAAAWPSADIVVMAQVGFSGFEPLVAALEAGKKIALSNKESLVIGGEILERLGLLDRERIYPVDSEHSAIWQCLGSLSSENVRKIYLTASGGPFFGWDKDQLKAVTPAMALKHPNWQMGSKITIDSATLMNKGLEVIEAMWLFDLKLEEIEVLIHRQSIIHSMVEYIDGSVIAQLGLPQMKLPIQYALTYPERKKNSFEKFNPYGSRLSFDKPDYRNFPCLELAYRAAGLGGSMTTVLNAANEIAVEYFLNGGIEFSAIPVIIEKTMNEHRVILKPEVSDIIKTDRWARQKAGEKIGELKGE